MSISQSMLPEFDQEMANTRRVLERIPEDKFPWTPHEKSMPLGRLSNHIAEIPSWTTWTLAGDSLDISPPGEPAYTMPEHNKREDVLKMFDQNVAEARAALAEASDERMSGN